MVYNQFRTEQFPTKPKNNLYRRLIDSCWNMEGLLAYTLYLQLGGTKVGLISEVTGAGVKCLITQAYSKRTL